MSEEDPTPDQEFLRRQDVMRWLTHRSIGLSEYTVEKLITNKAVKPIKLHPGAKYAVFSRTQIERDLLNKHRSGEGSASAEKPAAGGKTL